uniref:Uncharacterized protein n=1 Tax=Strombidium rassoulzadegani TaxID=1082188 RepID=A0A7S3CPY2_9SPIT|mmetsp:Transcript_17566/g.29651  ORF Transcript_17566/g.29651 Transcript_17566/m.29651 type:complete len:232 (+) Transcript_17566:1254-1949(+)
MQELNKAQVEEVLRGSKHSLNFGKSKPRAPMTSKPSRLLNNIYQNTSNAAIYADYQNAAGGGHGTTGILSNLGNNSRSPDHFRLQSIDQPLTSKHVKQSSKISLLNKQESHVAKSSLVNLQQIPSRQELLKGRQEANRNLISTKSFFNVNNGHPSPNFKREFNEYLDDAGASKALATYNSRSNMVRKNSKKSMRSGVHPHQNSYVPSGNPHQGLRSHNSSQQRKAYPNQGY